jgi:hypothetical protein
MNLLQEILYQLLVSFYRITSLQIGDWNLAQIGANSQDSFFNSGLMSWLQLFSLIITIALVIGLIVLMQKYRMLNQTIAATQQSLAPSEPAAVGPFQSRWAEILRHIDSTREGEWKFAVIEAESLVDAQLKNYFPGETMGERLMNIDKTKLLTINGLWEAHKVRNRLAHDPNYFLRHAEARRAVLLFEQTLKELEVL